MQRNRLTIFLVLLVFSFGLVNAQLSLLKDIENATSESLLVKNVNLEDQLHLIDSLIAMEEIIDEDEEYPAEYIYAEWDNTKLNPYQVKIAALPDSFVINCSDFYPPTENKVTSEYGPRWGRFHAGIDLRVNVGDSIRSAFDGKVRITRIGQRKKGYGYYVVIRHNNGLETLYGHLSKILVKPDQVVKAGEVIALGGNTGRSTGPHLHFEVRFLGNALNPRKIIDFDNFVVYNDKYTITKKETFKELTAFLNNPARYYTVKSGDTLSRIAKNNRTTVNKICKLNRLKTTSTIRPGQRIRVN
jgi:murein DD-endopeptidase MepM/ murein hydrolase activator NlpD